MPELPVALSNNAVASVDHGDGTYTLYSFMGIRPPALGLVNATLQSFRLDWPGGEWMPIADAPGDTRGRAKVAASAVTVGGRVYLIGGYTPARTEVTEKRLFRYEPETDSYTQLADVPFEVDDTVPAVYLDRYIYLISGWHGPINDNTTRVQVYDTLADVWAQATPVPGPLDGLFGHAGGISGSTLLYVDGSVSNGGFTISDRVFRGEIDASDPLVIAWEELPAHPGRPTYRAAGSLGATANGSILIAGGTDNPYNISGTGYNGQPAEALNQLLAYHAPSDRWVQLSVGSPRAPTMDHRNLAPLDGGWALVGGMTAPGEATGACWLLTLEPCRADLNADGVTDLSDLQLWIEAYHAGRPEAEQNGDGSVTPADFSAFVAGARRGCI